jgi:hypothetical protein
MAAVGGRAMLVCALGCAPPVLVLEEVGTSSGSLTLTPTDGPDASTTGDASGTTGPETCGIDFPCPTMIDLLFVIDNSGTMGEEQLNLARNFPMLIEELQGLAENADVNIMVTTTDFGNPLCDDMHKPDDYEEARGEPIASPCTERLPRFTGRGADPMVIEEACVEVCDPAAPVYPSDQFIHFDPESTNVQGGTPAQALACIGPQGIDGCGYEAPLETMLQALNPKACWNDPLGEMPNPECTDIGRYERPFIRPGAIVAVAIITDEADCSVRDYMLMEDEGFMLVDPVTGTREASSAICWNAGVVCSDRDPMTGEWSGCVQANKNRDGQVGVPDSEAVLHPLSRYITLLQSYQADGHDVIMLGVLGVPPVTRRQEEPPFAPTQGGVEALVFRDWRDPAYPAGDILPDEWGAAITAEDKQHDFGIGPGCTEVTDTYVGQGIPPVRIRAVCESLNIPAEGKTRCCIESICGEDFSPALRCLTGLIRDVIQPEG